MWPTPSAVQTDLHQRAPGEVLLKAVRHPDATTVQLRHVRRAAQDQINRARQEEEESRV